MSDLERRKERILALFNIKRYYLIYLIPFIIAGFGYYIRTRNLRLLIDVTTNKYIPIDLDSFAVLRYVLEIYNTGVLSSIDFMRYYPIGFDAVTVEFSFLAYFINYLYKFLHFFATSISIEKVHVLYPPLTLAIGVIFFFLLIKRLFDFRFAIVATSFLIVLPSFLFRTMAGLSDKESLATMFMFMAFYFYIVGLQSRKISFRSLFGALAGLFTGLMGYIWGGVNFVFLIIGSFTLITILLDILTNEDIYQYTSWFLVTNIVLTNFIGKFSVMSMIYSFTSGIMYLALLMILVDVILFKLNLLRSKEKIEKKMPLGLANFLISFFVLFVLTSIFIEPFFFFNKVKDMVSLILQPLTDRWMRTVAENHQPYIVDWIGQLGWKYVWSFLLGSVLLFYFTVYNLIGKKAWKITLVYFLFLIAFVFSRYSSESRILNGDTPLARFMFIGSLFIFIFFIFFVYTYSFYKNTEAYKNKNRLNKTNIFVILWFLIMLIAARTSVRLIFIASPIFALLGAYLFLKLYDLAASLKNLNYKLVLQFLTIFIIIFIFYGFTKIVLTQASNMGSSYNQQWQYGMQWVRENLSKDAVFAHWWDYGYFVQAGGLRATIVDGGNAMGPWNYFVGRYVMTAQNETDALEFLYSHNVTHLLMISDEVGKYPAYSSIGSDVNYDRYSSIPIYSLDPNIQETRDEKIYLYRGGVALDEDVFFEDKLFPAGGAGIGGFLVPVIQNDSQISFKRPLAVFLYGNEQIRIPLNCVYFNENLINFGDDGLDGCLRFIPTIEGNRLNPLNAAIYISPRVKRGLFAQLYLLDDKEKIYTHFKLAYEDKDRMPLAIYNGRLIGPLRIWEINYPKSLKINKIYLGTAYPDPRVTQI